MGREQFCLSLKDKFSASLTALLFLCLSLIFFFFFHFFYHCLNIFLVNVEADVYTYTSRVQDPARSRDDTRNRVIVARARVGMRGALRALRFRYIHEYTCIHIRIYAMLHALNQHYLDCENVNIYLQVKSQSTRTCLRLIVRNS